MVATDVPPMFIPGDDQALLSLSHGYDLSIQEVRWSFVISVVCLLSRDIDDDPAGLPEYQNSLNVT